MKVVNKLNGKDVTGLYLQLMKKEITNKRFEALTGLSIKTSS